MAKITTWKCDMCSKELPVEPQRQISEIFPTVNHPILIVLSWNGDRCESCVTRYLKESLDYFRKYIKQYIDSPPMGTIVTKREL